MTSPGIPGTPGTAAHASPPEAEALAAFPRQFARTRRFSLGTVRNVTLSPDGERALFLRTRSGSDPSGGLWIRDAGAERALADPATLEHAAPGAESPTTEEASRRERERDLSTGITGYAADDAAELAVFALGGTPWAVRTRRGEPFRLPAAGPVTDPRPSPDGRLIAYVTGGAVHVMAADGTGDRRVAGPAAGEEATVAFGLTDHVSAESLGRGRGYWWAPDSSALLVARVDNAQVRRRYLGDPSDPELPPRVQYYPRAGTANADVSLHLVRLDGTRTEVDWDRQAFEYVVAAGWDVHGPLVTVQSRDQCTLLTLGVDEQSGATRVLARQHDEHWVELLPGAYCRTASGALVLPYEDGDTRRLRVGEQVVTPPGLQVSQVLGTDGETVLFAAGEDPLETHVWSWSPDDGRVRVSEGAGLHSAVLRGGTVVLESVTPDGPRVTLLREGVAAGSISSLTEEPLIRPQPEMLTLGQRRLRSALFLPGWYEHRDPDAPPLPVLVAPYGGPGMRLVVRARIWPALVAQWFAEHGYAVLVTDGRGTPGRGPSWEKAIRGDQFTPVLEDQVDALHTAAATRPFLDLDRVGIQGWSFGGALATAAVLRRPDVFHAAVAGAPAIDPRLYDTHWKERFLGHPDRHPEHYDRCTLSKEAHLLRRPLLLVHGTADDNVAFAHTLRMSAALLAAGREHSVLPLPGQSHIVSDPSTAERLLRTQLLFLDKALRS
ncbi:alpha/beta fold hydrolase [Streptomyces sp. WMMB 322]|uniref:S9 family peptidase n=1 Tax=Streptomyces sp. WMMB 322 TaxID=1286821 RepID=UPI0008239017|nr:alpha/beta fold hydrolase [Streptomyces sp. WMMB 322]SCK58676.1 dipeptidyl-peptidase-4 [Streptomyces sp. WMMB 322]